MKNKINTMSTSFLDLLSGALGAVILLFVIVPKTSLSELELVEQIRSLDIETTELDSIFSIIQQEEDTISISEYKTVIERVQNHLKNSQVIVESLSKQVEEGQKEIKALKRKQHQLHTENTQLKTQVKSLPQPSKKVKKKEQVLAKMSKSNAAQQRQETTPKVKSTDKTFYFGFDSELSIVLNWDTSATDVDLYLEKDGTFVDGFNRTKSFGKWVRVPKKYLSKPTEVIIQKNLVPGSYKIHAHVSRPRRGGEATISGFVAMDLGGTTTQKFDFPKKKMNSTAPPYHKRADGSTVIGTLEVTENSISFN